MSIMQDAWKRRSCPLLTGVFFGDDRAVLLSIQVEAKRAIRVTIDERTTLPQLRSGRPLQWCELGDRANSTVRAVDKGLILHAGEGDMGGDGYVAVAELSTARLLWIAFFDGSNPFETISLDNANVVVARTNTGNTWLFPLESPEDVVVHIAS